MSAGPILKGGMATDENGNTYLLISGLDETLVCDSTIFGTTGHGGISAFTSLVRVNSEGVLCWIKPVCCDPEGVWPTNITASRGTVTVAGVYTYASMSIGDVTVALDSGAWAQYCSSIVTLDSNGGLVHARTFGRDNFAGPASLASGLNGDMYIAADPAQDSLRVGSIALTNCKRYKSTVVWKQDSAETTEWIAVIRSSDQMFFFSLCPDSANHVYAYGRCNGDSLFVNDQLMLVSQKRGAAIGGFLIRLRDGMAEWAQTINGQYSSYPQYTSTVLQIDKQSTVFLSGIANTDLQIDGAFYPKPDTDLWSFIVTFDSLAHTKSVRWIAPSSPDYTLGDPGNPHHCLQHDNSIVLQAEFGRPIHLLQDTLRPIGANDVFIGSLSSDELGATQSNIGVNTFSISRNCIGRILLPHATADLAGSTLALYDVLGHLMVQTKVEISGDQIIIKGLTPGRYDYILSQGHTILAHGAVIIP